MSPPKFKIGDRVNYSASGAPPYVGKVMAVRVDLAYGCQYQMHDGSDGLWWHESHLSLDVPETPKFKIGDRVKWKDYEGNTRKGVIYNQLDHPVRYSMESDRCLYWHDLSLSLDVPEAPKFKIGDRVVFKGTLDTDAIERFREGEPNGPYYELACRFGWWHESLLSLEVPEPSANSGLSNKLTELAIALVNSNLSLTHRAEVLDAIMNPKQFATDLEAKLGAEITKLHYDAADLDARLTKAIGAGHRERIAKEAAQRELAEANDKIKRLIGAQFDLSGVCAAERIAKESAQKELAEAIESTRSANAAYLDSVTKLSSVQKELAEAREGAARVRAKFESDFTFINNRLTEAREQIERLERKSKAQVESITHLSYRLTESRAGCEAEEQIETAQKALVEANDMINRLKTFIGLL